MIYSFRLKESKAVFKYDLKIVFNERLNQFF